MKAVEFMEKFGWFTSKEYMAGAIIFNNNLMVFTNRDELNQLIEAKELVSEHGTIERAKKYAESKYTAPEVAEALEKAIQLVESVNA